MSGTVRYAPGEMPVLVTRHGIVAIGGEVPPSLITTLWDEVSAGRGLAAVLEALTGAFGTSLAAIPAFVVALAEESSTRLVVRGALAVTVESAGGVETISGTGVTTWSERVVETVASLQIARDDDDRSDAAPPAYPVEGGVVFASRVEWLPAAVTSAATATEQPKLVKAPEPAAVPAMEPVIMTETVAVAAADDAVAEDVAVAEVAEVAAIEEAEIEEVAGEEVAGEEAEAEAVAAGPWAAFAVAPRLPVPEPIPVRGPKPNADDEPAAAIPGLIDSGAVLSMTSTDTLMPPEATQGPAAPTEAADDPVWGATVARPAPQAPASLPGDHDGETISVAEARALRDSTPGVHDSAPAPLAPPRPPAPGRLLLSTGQVLLLDRTVVIGRRPRSTRVTGTDLPHLVAVDSPQQDISRSHIELRVEGDAIVATDLHTTNGTTLHRAGAEPMRLHPGEATVVVPGDVIDLGDDITVLIEEVG